MYLLRRLIGAGIWSRTLLFIALALPGLFPQVALSQAKQPVKKPATAQPSATSTTAEPAHDSSLGDISGTITDQAGTVAVGAKIELAHGENSPKLETVSGDNGEYAFNNVAPGPFQLTVSAPGFDTKIFSGEVKAGQTFLVPAIPLTITTVTAEVKVELTPIEVAEEQLKEQEQQRVFGFIPNFYVTYEADPAPLIARQKFQLAWRSVIDPITIVGAGALAGIQQAADDYSGYGQGAAGYGKRFGAAYADIFSATFLGSAIFPALLKQDPRYFYRGPDSSGSRWLYAIGNSVICKGDNKKWQVNYSNILGSFAAGGISYLYYPESDRNVSTIMQNSIVRIAESSLAGVFQEFVLRRFTTTRDKKRAGTQP